MSSSPPPPCSKAAAAAGAPAANKYCLCAPTTHPGSFRCRLHRSPPVEANKAPATAAATATAADQEAKDEAAAAAAVARELLERMRMARKPRRPGGVPAGAFRPGPSRLGATTTAMED